MRAGRAVPSRARSGTSRPSTRRRAVAVAGRTTGTGTGTAAAGSPRAADVNDPVAAVADDRRDLRRHPAVLGLLGGAVNLITDVMWYDALGRRDVFAVRLWAQIGLFAIGFGTMLVLALLSIWLARRISPQAPLRRLGGIELPDASRVIGIGLAVVAVLLALGSGAAWSGNWETVLLFLNGEEWGTRDPTLGRDIGFYVFDLPFWRFLLGWATTTLIIVGILTLATYAVRAVRWQFHLSAPVRGHLSVIGALLLVIVAAGYQLDIAELAYSQRGWDGNVQAALYTDMNAQYPAYVILTVVALVSAGLLLLNTWFRTLWLLGLAAGRLVPALDPGRWPLSDLRAARPGGAERAQRRAVLHPQSHGGDPRGLRPRLHRDAPLHRRAGADGRGLRGRSADDRQPAAVGLPTAAHDVRAAADPSPLLHLHRYRHRSLRGGRRAARDHAQRA